MTTTQQTIIKTVLEGIRQQSLKNTDENNCKLDDYNLEMIADYDFYLKRRRFCPSPKLSFESYVENNYDQMDTYNFLQFIYGERDEYGEIVGECSDCCAEDIMIVNEKDELCESCHYEKEDALVRKYIAIWKSKVSVVG